MDLPRQGVYAAIGTPVMASRVRPGMTTAAEGEVDHRGGCTRTSWAWLREALTLNAVNDNPGDDEDDELDLL
jgi:hypothetical protein